MNSSVLRPLSITRRAERKLAKPSVSGDIGRNSHSSSAWSAPSSNHSFLHRAVPGLQAKLVVGEPNDQFEQEADRVADRVMRMPAEVHLKTASVPFGTSNHAVQRKCACGGTPGPTGECETCRKKRLGVQRRAANSQGPGEAPPIVHEVLRSPGQPLDAGTRAFMEPRFGRDFSGVRVHNDSRASQSAETVNAVAYTVGHDIVFRSPREPDNSDMSRKLLAHELAHVLQQSGPARVAQSSSIVSESIGARPSAIAVFRQADGTTEPSDGRPGCNILPGVPNNTCSAYASNSWWLPSAYVNNATCACIQTPNVPTANCVRKFLQDRLAATPAWVKTMAVMQKPLEDLGLYLSYQAFVQAILTPRIYRDHVDAYSACCCPSGPAPYLAWMGVSSVPLPCPIVGSAIRQYGSCHGTPGTW